MGAAVTATTSTPAAAAVVLGSRAASGPLGLTGTVVGRHRNLFRTFSIVSSNSVGALRYGNRNFVLTLNAGSGADSVQVFDADTGALHMKGSTGATPTGSFGHDGKGNVYFGVGKTLMVASLGQRTLRTLGAFPAGMLTSYEFQFDHRGRIWTGSYPLGRVVCLNPADGRELARTPILGAGNQYARGITISPDGRTVWAGAGTADPAVYRIDVDRPSSPVRIALPSRKVPSMVMRMHARGRKVFVWHTNASGKETISVYDDVTRTWSACPTPIVGWCVSAAAADGHVYVNAKGSLVRLNPHQATLEAVTVATGLSATAVHTALAGSTVYLIDEGPSLLAAQRLAMSGTALGRVSYGLIPGPVKTQSMVIDRRTNVLYAGGFQGDGVCSTNLATGAFAHSAASAGVAQIEGMIVDGGHLYMGSYGGAVIVRHSTSAGVRAGTSYRRMAALGSSHRQDRIFAWAIAQDHVVFGTVPEYGDRGGALGTVHRATGAVRVYNKLIPELSIVGLTATGHTVYGTTSVRGGMGSADWHGDAVVFRADARTGALTWRRTLPGLDEAYDPVLLGTRLYVGTLDTVVELRVSDGAPVRTFVLGSRAGRATWNSVQLARIPDTDRLAHLAGGVLTVLEPATGRSSTVLTGANNQLGFDGAGALWVTVGNDVVKLRLNQAAVTAGTVGVRGAIGVKYTAGGGAAVYGPPLFAERTIPGGAYQVFRKDGRSTKILWSPSTGARAVKEYGAIGRAWKQAGCERGWGWPVTDEYRVGTEVRQRFSRGVTAHYRAGRTWTT
ncbi:hypothetical protein [Kocuria sp. SM24M-10]|uniref:hypothetical protein n=1 Tax=Kocuria sp. SM24M-10 TaxID=1660349 RepID=UPI000699EB2D|nr:hypothetical protein [Kocuria sp. SM24M-10]